MNELVLTDSIALPVAQLPDMFGKPGAIRKLLDDLREKALAEAPDLTTAKGRARIASLANNVAKAKVALDNAGKDLTDEWRRQTDAVNAERRMIRDTLDALKVEVRKPLSEWEAAEEARRQERRDRIARIVATQSQPKASAEECAALVAKVEAVAIDDWWQEFAAEAAKAKDAALTELRRQHAEAVRREAEAAELERLRAEAAAREEKERQEAAAKAEAERQARFEREKAEAAERARKEAEEQAQRATEEERHRAAEREAELQRRIEAAEKEKEAAAQAERDRIDRERRAAEEAAAKRAKDEAHRRRIKTEMAIAIEPYCDAASAGRIAAALLDGKVPHARVML